MNVAGDLRRSQALASASLQGLRPARAHRSSKDALAVKGALPARGIFGRGSIAGYDADGASHAFSS